MKKSLYGVKLYICRDEKNEWKNLTILEIMGKYNGNTWNDEVLISATFNLNLFYRVGLNVY